MRAAVVGTRAATEGYEREEVWARASGWSPVKPPCVCSYLNNEKSGNLLLTLKAHGCIDGSSRHHARAPRAVRPTPVRRRPQDPLEPATAKRSQAYGSLGDNHVQVKRRSRCVRVDHPESAGFSRREAR